jgi:hypothetical protein
MRDVTQVIAGSGSLYLAETSNQAAVDFLAAIQARDGDDVPTEAEWLNAGFDGIGYTDDGVEFDHANTFKEITVDEELDSVDQLLTGQKTEVKLKMAQASLQNLGRCIAGSTFIATGDKNILRFGSPTPDQIKEFVIGFQGPAPSGDANRVIGIWRTKNLAAVAHKYQRTDKVMFEVNFTGLADSSMPKGQRIGFMVDFAQAGS